MFSSNDPLLVNQLTVSLKLPKETEKYEEFFNEYFNKVANASNSKPSGLFDLRERGNFKRYFTPDDPLKLRNVYRYVSDIHDEVGGDLTAGNTYTVAHNITGIDTPTALYGTATDSSGNFLPLPYPSTTANANIELFADATDITLILGAAAATLEQAYVTFEYTKD